MNDLLYIPPLSKDDGKTWSAGSWINLSQLTYIIDYTDGHWGDSGPVMVCHFAGGQSLKVHGTAAIIVKNHLNTLKGIEWFDQDTKEEYC